MRKTRPQHYDVRTCPARRGDLHTHETRATATFALSLPHPIWKCLLFVVFYSMSCLRCAPDSSHSDISNQARHLDLLILKLCVFLVFYNYPLGNVYFSLCFITCPVSDVRQALATATIHVDMPCIPSALPWPALASPACCASASFCAHPISRGGMGEALWITRR